MTQLWKPIWLSSVWRSRISCFNSLIWQYFLSHFVILICFRVLIWSFGLVWYPTIQNYWRYFGIKDPWLKHTMKGNKSATIIFTFNVNIPSRDYNIYIKCKYLNERFPLFGKYLTLAASSFGVVAWFKDPWFTYAWLSLIPK